MGTTSLDVLALGGVGVDTIIRVATLPVPFADTVHVPPMVRYVGHSGSGWALGLHALEVHTHLVDLVGDDPEGLLARERFAAAGLPFTGVVVPEGTKRSVNLVADDGRRMSFHDGRGQALPAAQVDCHRSLLGAARHAHVTINDWTRPALREAVASGHSVSTDLNDWDGVNPYHEEFAFAADLVFLSTVGVTERLPEVVGRVFDQGRAALVVSTAGAAGCRVHVRGGSSIDVPAAALPGRPAVDSNGAGDAFGAAFLAAWLSGADPVECARWGVVAGAWACATPGTNADPIDLPTLRSLL